MNVLGEEEKWNIFLSKCSIIQLDSSLGLNQILKVNTLLLHKVIQSKLVEEKTCDREF
jgi:hypothetical protein